MCPIKRDGGAAKNRSFVHPQVCLLSIWAMWDVISSISAMADIHEMRPHSSSRRTKIDPEGHPSSARGTQGEARASIRYILTFTGPQDRDLLVRILEVQSPKGA